MPANAVSAAATGGAAALRRARGGRSLRFATVCVDQVRSRPSRESDVGPILRRVAGLERWPDHARRHELVEMAWTACAGCSRRYQLCDDPAVRSDGDALPGFDPADVPTEIVFQLANAR